MGRTVQRGYCKPEGNSSQRKAWRSKAVAFSRQNCQGNLARREAEGYSPLLKESFQKGVEGWLSGALSPFPRPCLLPYSGQGHRRRIATAVCPLASDSWILNLSLRLLLLARPIDLRQANPKRDEEDSNQHDQVQVLPQEEVGGNRSDQRRE